MCVYMCMCMCMCACICMCVHAYMCVWVGVCTYVCVSMCTCVYLCVYACNIISGNDVTTEKDSMVDTAVLMDPPNSGKLPKTASFSDEGTL